MKKWTAVECIWEDAHGGPSGWCAESEVLHKPHRVREIGLIIRDDLAGLSLVQARDETGGSVHGPSFIPRSCIVSVKELT